MIRARFLGDRGGRDGLREAGGRQFEKALFFLGNIEQGDDSLVQRRIVAAGLLEIGDSGLWTGDFPGDFEDVFLGEAGLNHGHSLLGVALSREQCEIRSRTLR
jgi:hypothetical protein